MSDDHWTDEAIPCPWCGAKPICGTSAPCECWGVGGDIVLGCPTDGCPASGGLNVPFGDDGVDTAAAIAAWNNRHMDVDRAVDVLVGWLMQKHREAIAAFPDVTSSNYSDTARSIRALATPDPILAASLAMRERMKPDADGLIPARVKREEG